MNKLEVGMYVRTNLGIEKIISLESEYNALIAGVGTKRGFIQKKRIIKSSLNIIDLIEVGDYVNGQRVIEVYKDDFNKDTNLPKVVFRNDLIEYDFCQEKDITEILTKEQYESEVYRVE